MRRWRRRRRTRRTRTRREKGSKFENITKIFNDILALHGEDIIDKDFRDDAWIGVQCHSPDEKRMAGLRTQPVRISRKPRDLKVKFYSWNVNIKWNTQRMVVTNGKALYLGSPALSLCGGSLPIRPQPGRVASEGQGGCTAGGECWCLHCSKSSLVAWALPADLGCRLLRISPKLCFFSPLPCTLGKLSSHKSNPSVRKVEDCCFMYHKDSGFCEMQWHSYFKVVLNCSYRDVLETSP